VGLRQGRGGLCRGRGAGFRLPHASVMTGRSASRQTPIGPASMAATRSTDQKAATAPIA
jgi:hypothetical protein